MWFLQKKSKLILFCNILYSLVHYSSRILSNFRGVPSARPHMTWIPYYHLRKVQRVTLLNAKRLVCAHVEPPRRKDRRQDACASHYSIFGNCSYHVHTYACLWLWFLKTSRFTGEFNSTRL